ncbi:MAG: Dabb family protein [Acidimicrobiaceae bacterium]
MFRHCVLMRFAPSADESRRTAVAEGIRNLADTIPEVQAICVGPDAGIRDDNFDLAAVVDFDDRDAYSVYATHPSHVELLTDLVAPILIERAAVQFEI